MKVNDKLMKKYCLKVALPKENQCDSKEGKMHKNG
jgi:hypothetical protein